MAFNATTWRVQLPVNASGQLRGTAVTNWNPLTNYAPWYRKFLGTMRFKSPAKGAATTTGRAPRCELAQVQRWRSAKISFYTTLVSCDGRTTIFQVRQVGGSHEVVKVEFDAAKSVYTVHLNNYEDSFYGTPGKVGDRVLITCSVGSNLTLTIDDKQFRVPTRAKYGKELQFKLGVYGRCNAEARVTSLKWAIL